MATSRSHKAMVRRTNAKGSPYWAGIGPWRNSVDAARKDADAHRLEHNPVAKIRIYTLSSEEYNG